jgi:pyrimidine operon attenuation protein/uracil phosphoribosyltransferase
MFYQKAIIMDSAAVDRALMRISHEILEKDGDSGEIAVVGIHRRGVPMAARIAENIARFSELSVLTGELDISLYRDDLTEIGEAPQVVQTQIGFDVRNRTVVLVDDVLYTGRTARAAMDAIMALGRPAAIRLAVLIDRGHRELPIRADFVGKNVPTSKRELVEVRLPEFDGKQEVAVLEQRDGGAPGGENG